MLNSLSRGSKDMDQKVEVKAPTLNEKILQECYELYTNPDKGLIDVAKTLSAGDILPPKREVVVLLLGNHSAGKSSFINWYVGENIQKAGVAIETQGFAFIQHGIRRESLLFLEQKIVHYCKGGFTVKYSVLDFLTMEISSSTQRKFNVVTFIDSPGLVDGGMEYPYDVNRALLYLGSRSDLIYVFFDPVGQALCKRTLSVVEEMSASRADALRFVLSKADEAGSESDRQKVMMQIVQELCTRPGVNRQGFEMKSIYIPTMCRSNPGVNEIEEICAEIEKTVSFIVQKTLTELENDCKTLEKKVDKALENSELRIFDWRAMICYSIAIACGLTSSTSGRTKSLETLEMLQLITVFLATVLGFIFSNGKSIFLCHRHLRLIRRKQTIMAARRRKDAMLLEYLGQSLRKAN